MSSKDQKLITELRKQDFKPWTLNLWLVKRKLVSKEASYTILRVDVEPKLQRKLKHSVVERVQRKDYAVEEYLFQTADQDGRVFTIDASETDFVTIQKEIQRGHDNDKASSFDDLLDSWAYVVTLKREGKQLYALRKINKLSKAKKVKSLSSLLFKDHMLIDLGEEQVFTIDTKVDFFEYEGKIFITNKKEFESALNFRKGMEENRDTVLGEFDTLGLFHDIEPIRKSVGTNLHFLRRVSAIKKSGYYKDMAFMSSLIRLNESEKWGLVIQSNKIVVTEDNVELVLTLLNNSRLKSPINNEVFDAQVKKKVNP